MNTVVFVFFFLLAYNVSLALYAKREKKIKDHSIHEKLKVPAHAAGSGPVYGMVFLFFSRRRSVNIHIAPVTSWFPSYFCLRRVLEYYTRTSRRYISRARTSSYVLYLWVGEKQLSQNSLFLGPLTMPTRWPSQPT
jgi:hypothetical protein